MAFHSRVLNQYQQVKVEGGVQAADPHRLVAMLLEGAKEKIHGAKLRILHNHGVKDVQEKGALIGGSIAIVDALRASLDMEKGGEIAANLEQLYDYMTRLLPTTPRPSPWGLKAPASKSWLPSRIPVS